MGKANCERIRTSVRLRPLTEQESEALPRNYNDVYCADNKVYIVAKARGAFTPTISSKPVAAKSLRGTPEKKLHSTSSSPHFGRISEQTLNNQYNEHLSYGFEKVFGEEVQSRQVYENSGTQEIVKSIYHGFNGTVFVYGQTGTGKTYTMDDFIGYAIQDIFLMREEMASTKEVGIFLSVVELYNEIIKDMIGETNNMPLRMGSVNDGGASVVIDGLVEQEVRTAGEFMEIFEEARKKRVTAGTIANARSSRSHLLVRIKVELLDRVNTGGPTKTAMWSCLNMVDLAGSERVDKTGSSALKSRFKEATNINRDLLCLGNVITALVDRSEGKKAHVPYRTSKLTRILQDGLGGNGRTAVIVTMTRLPGWHLEQTKHTLEFASRANRVICAPRVNIAELPQDHAVELKWYQEEIERLRELLAKSQEEIKIIGQRSTSSRLDNHDSVEAREAHDKFDADAPLKLKHGKGVSFDKDSILKELEEQTAKFASVQAHAQHQLREKFQRRARSFAVRRQSSKLETCSEDLDFSGASISAAHRASRSGPPTHSRSEDGVRDQDGFDLFAASPKKSLFGPGKGAFPRRSTSGVSTFSSMVASKKQEYTELSKQLEAVTHNLIAERRAKEDQESKLRTMEDALKSIAVEKAGEIEELASKLASVDADREAKEAAVLAKAQELASAKARIKELEAEVSTLQASSDMYQSRAESLQTQMQAIGIDVKLVNNAKMEVATLSSANHVKETVMSNQQSMLMMMSKRIHDVSEQLSEVNAENEILRRQLAQAESRLNDTTALASGNNSLHSAAVSVSSPRGEPHLVGPAPGGRVSPREHPLSVGGADSVKSGGGASVGMHHTPSVGPSPFGARAGMIEPPPPSPSPSEPREPRRSMIPKPPMSSAVRSLEMSDAGSDSRSDLRKEAHSASARALEPDLVDAIEDPAGPIHINSIAAGAMSGPLPSVGVLDGGGENGEPKMYENDAALTSQSTAAATECVKQLVAFQAAASQLHACMLGEVNRMQRLSDAVRQVRAASPEISSAAGAPLAYAYSIIDSGAGVGSQLDSAVEAVESHGGVLQRSLQKLVNGLILIPNVEMPVFEEEGGELDDLEFHLPGPPSRNASGEPAGEANLAKIYNDKLDRLKGVAMALRTKLGVKQAELAMAHGSDQKLRAKVKALEAAVLQYNGRMEELEETLDILQRENADLYNVLNEFDEADRENASPTTDPAPSTGVATPVSAEGPSADAPAPAPAPTVDQNPLPGSSPASPRPASVPGSLSGSVPGSVSGTAVRIKSRALAGMRDAVGGHAAHSQRPTVGSIMDQMAGKSPDQLRDEILELWQQLYIPLWHRTDFFSALWENAGYVSVEHARLKWIEERMKRDVPTRDRAKRHLAAEVDAVCAALHAMPRSARAPIYTEWGIELKRKQRKRLLADQLWRSSSPAQRSAATHRKVLSSGSANELTLSMPVSLLKPATKITLEATYAALAPVSSKAAGRSASGTWRNGTVGAVGGFGGGHHRTESGASLRDFGSMSAATSAAAHAHAHGHGLRGGGVSRNTSQNASSELMPRSLPPGVGVAHDVSIMTT